MRPLLYMDVDGVHNCPGAAAGHCDEREFVVPVSDEPQMRERRGRLREAMGWPATDEPPRIPVWLPSGSQERVAELTEVFDCVWCTGWRATAPLAFDTLLGLDRSWPVLPWTDMKLPAILDQAAGRPWAFVDDEIDFELGRLTVPLPAAETHLLVECDPAVGLTDEHVAQLLSFARSHAGR